MSKRGLLVVVAVLAVCAGWAVYAQGTGPAAAGTPSPTEQGVACTTHACGPASCGGDCAACPGGPDGCEGACDKAGMCAKHASAGCGGYKGRSGYGCSH
jgi:hypothetical protein